jgi:hypothetical protein
MMIGASVPCGFARARPCSVTRGAGISPARICLPRTQRNVIDLIFKASASDDQPEQFHNAVPEAPASSNTARPSSPVALLFAFAAVPALFLAGWMARSVMPTRAQPSLGTLVPAMASMTTASMTAARPRGPPLNAVIKYKVMQVGRAAQLREHHEMDLSA